MSDLWRRSESHKMVDIQILEASEIDVSELVQFTLDAEQQQLDEQLRCGMTEDEVEKHIQGVFKVPYYFILARDKGKLLGWVGLYPYTASMVYLDNWQPLVLPSENSDDLFRQLVQESINHTRKIGRSRLEIFLMKLTDDIRPTYERYRVLYESAGMRKGKEWAQMVCDPTALDLSEPDCPDGFSLKPLIEVSNEEIWPCYNETFLSSSDGRYLSQTEEQRRENFDDFFDRSKQIENDASLLLYSDDKIVGFMKINIYDSEGFVNGVGIHPDHRGRGLARYLMTASLIRAAGNGMNHLVLEVDIENQRAIRLYEKLGFEKQRGSISHVWTE